MWLTVCDCYRNGFTPLYAAAHEGHGKIVELLLENGGASIDREMSDGSTPLYIAALEGHLEVVELLLDRGCVIVDKVQG